ncbi:helix-turn-helix domain-containing protein [Glycomyces salinus]|uniref:helix-turn-helix domain-containing protein n=1 Tax=Glycomyces salinus TaxID=980294 RepID=UPI0018EE1517|nr:helix-turn-helix transcriptional regulator [Glycomyces salinus]
MTASQPTIARRSLGRALERHRESNGLTRAQAGREIGYSGQTIQRIEEGTQATRSMVVEKLCELYCIKGAELSHLTTLAVRGKERGWWEPYFDIGAEKTSRPKIPLFLETEQVALQIRVLETEVIPGLLQTPEYLRELQDAYLEMPDEVAESWRALRTHRQKLLYNRSPLPEIQFLIGRAAIDYLGEMPPEVREGQLNRLREVAARGSAEIKIITRVHAAASGAFNLLYPGDETPPFVFMDAADGCRYIEQPQLVSMYEQTFSSACDRSVPVEEYLR